MLNNAFLLTLIKNLAVKFFIHHWQIISDIVQHDRKLHYFSTDCCRFRTKITCAQNFNFPQKCSWKWGFLDPNLALWMEILDNTTPLKIIIIMHVINQ